MQAMVRTLRGRLARSRSPASTPRDPGVSPTWRPENGFAPRVLSAEPLLAGSIDVGDAHRGMLFGRVLAAGPIQYNYVFMVYGRHDRQPCLWVTSERPRTGYGPPYLGLFHGTQRHNMGSDDRWWDQGSFLRAAVQLGEDLLAPGGGR